MAGYKRRFGDRYDGRRLRSLDPFYKIIPFIMRSRIDSQNFSKRKSISPIPNRILEKGTNPLK